MLLEDRVQLERFPAAEDSDSATSQTVSLMCRYIRESSDDPAIRAAAGWAHEHFGGNSADPAMQAWAVFWFVKHQVRFVVDEAPMFRLGEANQQDLLISPAVLIRMKDPQEDCDGFTMLVCALLKCLGIPFCIATIACSPDDPGRWSHVFPLAMLKAGPLPLDASHGSGPGWMVPAAHTFRWQCWDENGNPVGVGRPRRHSLNGWVRPGASYGLGQDLGDDLISAENDVSGDFTNLENAIGSNPDILSSALPTGATPAAATTPSNTGFNLASFFSGLATDATSTAKSYITAQQQEQLAQTGAYTASNILSTMVPLAVAGLGIFLLVSVLGSKK